MLKEEAQQKIRKSNRGGQSESYPTQETGGAKKEEEPGEKKG